MGGKQQQQQKQKFNQMEDGVERSRKAEEEWVIVDRPRRPGQGDRQMEIQQKGKKWEVDKEQPRKRRLVGNKSDAELSEGGMTLKSEMEISGKHLGAIG